MKQERIFIELNDAMCFLMITAAQFEWFDISDHLHNFQPTDKVKIAC